MLKKKKPILFAGVTPSGDLTLGHYCNFISYIISEQEKYEVIVMIADLHAITVPKKGFDYGKKSREIMALLYACGLKKEENCTIFVQSQISEHSELFCLLSSQITINKLENMIQYKEKKEKKTGTAFLLTYPILMASDIFLYDPDIIVIGEDQKQHSELIKKISLNLNDFCSFSIVKKPFFLVPTLGSKILGLKNPDKKMSKSKENDCLFLLDDSKTIEKKILSSKTDSENRIYFSPDKKPGISNLLVIYSVFSKKKIEEVEEIFANSSYHEFKKELISLLQKKMEIIKRSYNDWIKVVKDKILEKKKIVKKIARQNLKKIKKNFGIIVD